MSEEIDLPVIPKHRIAAKTKNGKTRVPFAEKLIRIKGNDKTDWNIIDTVLGCKGGCLGCYAEGSPRTNFYKIKFDAPVGQVLDAPILQTDCLRAIVKPWKTHDRDGKLVTGIGRDWMRNGVMGDPSYDWDLAIRAAEASSMIGMRNIIITKFWKYPTVDQLERLALAGVIFHWSVIPGYEWTPAMQADKDLNRAITIIDLLQKYDKMTSQESVYVRLCTMPFAPSHDVGALLDQCQQGFYEMAEAMGFRIIETPWRLSPNDPRVEFCDKHRLRHPGSYKAMKAGSKMKLTTKLYGGALYFEGDAEAENNTFEIGCVTDCGICPNQCGTITEDSVSRYEMAAI